MARLVDTKSLEYEVARELGVPVDQVRLAQRSQFSLVAKTIKKGEFDTVRLRFFGKFWVKPGRLKHLNAHKNKPK